MHNKVTAKDIFVGYRDKGHSLQVGQFYEPFSMDMFCSTSDMHFPQVAGVTCAFGISRRIGLLYAYDDKKYSLSLGLSVYTNFQMLSIVRCVKNMRK
ncbi:porin [Bacteroides uniformis]|uniref:porin n=1 Tax=Bacteroides uniformis TaxID=820 RepID=UPI0036F2E288